MCLKNEILRNIYPFTRDRLSSRLVRSVWFGTLLRPSVTFTISCSMLLHEPVHKEQEKCYHFRSFHWLLQSLVFPLLCRNINLKQLVPQAFGMFQRKIITPCSSSRAMWTRALFLVLLISVCSLSWHALRLASVLADRPGSRSFSQYQAQPCSNHTTTPSRARHRPMHSSAFPWQLWRPRTDNVMKRQFRQREKFANLLCRQCASSDESKYGEAPGAKLGDFKLDFLKPFL